MGGDEPLGDRVISRLDAADCVLVAVDLQERLLPAIHDTERVVAATGLILRAAKSLDLPVLMTTQYQKGLGPTRAALTELAPGVTPIDKMTFSCFGSTTFVDALRATGRKTLLLCGVEGHICVLQTGLDAIANGYSVHVITDATGSRAEDNLRLGHRRLEGAGAVLSSTEMAIYELLGVSGTPAFKSLLPFFK